MNPSLAIAHRVLICVTDVAQAPKLIACGARLMSSLHGATGTVVYVHRNALDEHHWDDLQAVAHMRALCDPHQLVFESITVGKRPIAQGLAPVIDKRGTTQIVLGQAPQSWFDRLRREPLGSQLLRAHPEVEQHIVDVSHSPAVHEALETGLDAALIPGPEGCLRLRTGTAAEAAIRGIFFPDACTEFDHGYFVRTDCDRLQVVRIVDGVAMAQQQDTHSAELTAKLSGVTWRKILHLFDGSLPMARVGGTEVVSLR